MLEAVTYQGMLRDINNNQVKEDTIGILITRPDLEVGKSILCSLNYYHHVTGDNLNFYLPGYGNNIESSISSIRICQDGERVYFEFTKDKYIADYLKDRIITRTDLGFIVENCEDRVFKPNNHIGVNVNKFLDLDDYSMLNCVGEIFTQEWIEKQLTRIK